MDAHFAKWNVKYRIRMAMVIKSRNNRIEFNAIEIDSR